MGSLSLLQDYFSSDEDTDNHKERLPQPKLPEIGVPRSISREPDKRKVLEDGRVRSFPHEAGNWATYIAIPVSTSSEILGFVEDIESALSSFSLKQVDDWHISLTRVVVLRYHWISGFVETVRDIAKNTLSFPIVLQGLSVYANDDKTRTFIALKVNIGVNAIDQVVSKLDSCLLEYSLPQFYDTRSFHMSILWGPGDFTKKAEMAISKLTSCHLDNINFPMNITNCYCKAGNKMFSFEFS